MVTFNLLILAMWHVPPNSHGRPVRLARSAVPRSELPEVDEASCLEALEAESVAFQARCVPNSRGFLRDVFRTENRDVRTERERGPHTSSEATSAATSASSEPVSGSPSGAIIIGISVFHPFKGTVHLDERILVLRFHTPCHCGWASTRGSECPNQRQLVAKQMRPALPGGSFCLVW